MSSTEFVHRKTGERVTGEQYIRGMHPPPAGIRVTMGMSGVLARTADNMQVFDGDWLLRMADGHVEVFTNKFVRAEYRRADEEEDSSKPVKLG